MMTSFSKKLARAKRAQRPHEDVTVALDVDVAERREALAQQRENLEDQLAAATVAAAADQRLSAPDNGEVLTEAFLALKQDELDLDREEADEGLVTLRFWRLPGLEWNDLLAQHPARQGVLVDMTLGANVHAVCLAAAKLNGKVVEDGKNKPVSAAQWDDLFDTLPGYSVSLICDAIYSLNVHDPALRDARLGKALTLPPVTSPGSSE